MTEAQTPAPVVSVVLPTHIRGPFLAEALASVKDQDFVDWELLLVDDGSDDPAGLEEEVSIDPRMRVIHHTHGGVANARNVGLGQCRGSYVAFLDHDDVWYPNHLSVNVAALEDDARPSPLTAPTTSSKESTRRGGARSDSGLLPPGTP
jgi:glycosyltransferase involved in cell wall biosynthesis